MSIAKKILTPLLLIVQLSMINYGCAQKEKTLATNNKIKINMSDKEKFEKDEHGYRKLTKEEERVIVYKGTEYPGTGKFNKHKEEGVYTCRRCGAYLYYSKDKFDSGCGWPSFDDEVKGAVQRIPDPDGMRTEIVCSNCKGHLGHVFLGEGFTSKDTRHCVNSVSMDFIPLAQLTSDKEKEVKTDTAVFASGCFWGTQYFLQRAEGVINTEVGYTGGKKLNPTYYEVSDGNTGHLEAVRVTFDPSKTSFEKLTKIFFETHDPTQTNGQGPDIGSQYLSAIFYKDENQKKVAETLIQQLEKKGYKVATKLLKAGEFYIGEEYHQDYYNKNGKTPYCHKYTQRF